MPAHPLSSDAGLKDAACTTLRELLTIAKRYKKRRNRLDALFLFSSRTLRKGRTVKEIPKATIAYTDGPEEELLLSHRDTIERLDATVIELRAAVERCPDMDARALGDVMKSMARLEFIRDVHLKGMREILANLARELMSQENVLSRVVAEGARLAQMAQINREKIDADTAARTGGIDSKATSELQAIAENMKRRIEAGELFVIDGDGDGQTG